MQRFKLVDVGTDDEAFRFAGDDDEALDGSAAGGALGFLDDGAQFFEGTTAQRVGA